MIDQKQHILCDIELRVSGPTEKATATFAANTLRTIANKLEQHGYADGHHEIMDLAGQTMGTIYLDFSEVINMQN
ncbi:hypothetical protein GCM10007385_24890 [Tateyamaria omphalii]|uniref:hypothetical protein n=1 Tax=Tateyamaria omphalii TaxID=299262 RepID=UPI0016719455|nr:hypothetical protein [Tateyamaria omphalii]GGX55371.1 hypothetical protein GCM10007385_24890 [Tateyamaria omphalii]